MKSGNFMYKLLHPNSGVSSKRFIGLFGFIVLVFIALVDLFSNLTVSEYVYEGIVFVVLGSLGSTAVEAFGNRNKNFNQYPYYGGDPMMYNQYPAYPPMNNQPGGQGQGFIEQTPPEGKK